MIRAVNWPVLLPEINCIDVLAPEYCVPLCVPPPNSDPPLSLSTYCCVVLGPPPPPPDVCKEARPLPMAILLLLV